MTLIGAGGSAHGATIRASYDWYCPQCGFETTTNVVPKPRDFPTHVCPKLRFLSVALLRKGTKAKIEVMERGDYIGKEIVTLDPERKRPVQAIVTTRDTGTDTAVFAPAAQSRGD